MAAGLSVLVFTGVQLRGTDGYAAQAQSTLRHGLERDWAAAQPASRPAVPAAVTLGNGVAVLRVPRFGLDYARVVVEGVGQPDLRRGPGHVPGTALPGSIGNFAVAGHRTTYGAPFGRLGELRAGDAVVVETRDEWLTYTVTSSRIVPPTAVSVTAPVAGEPGRRPTAATMTLMTCNPRYSDRERLAVLASLTSQLPKSAGLPAALRA